MYKLLSLWYRSKVLKYHSILVTHDELLEKAETPGGLTLTELIQATYMSDQKKALEHISKESFEPKLVEEAPSEDELERKGEGQYL